MTDWPESVQEWEKATQYISREPAYDPGMVADIADAAIRDLKVMVEAMRGTIDKQTSIINMSEFDLDAWLAKYNEARVAQEQAEAERDALYEQVKMYGAANGELKDRLDEAEAEARELREQSIERKWIDATPDASLPTRLLMAYVDDAYWSDNTAGVAPTNPVIVAMNEHREQRNVILRRAIEVLARYEEAHGGGDD